MFQSSWQIDGEQQQKSLLQLIKSTTATTPQGLLSAYRDNGAIIKGFYVPRWFPLSDSQIYTYKREAAHLVIKAETHNHPTAIAPLPGAATGSGGEIRDETAVGLGAEPKAGFVGFCVSDLHIEDFQQPWETPTTYPPNQANALRIMLEGPIGNAQFNNEFGRPSICGYFRTFEKQQTLADGTWGYHKPVMLAGGLGTVRDEHIRKASLCEGDQLVLLGGPSFRIGLGGGILSSAAVGSSDTSREFASVQRHNPEMQQRCQQVINHCWARGNSNPIIAIHDVGSGGLSNAVPELLHEGGVGGRINLRTIPCGEPGMYPLEIWANESQERYVLALKPKDLPWFEAICKRERCPMAVIGECLKKPQLEVYDEFDAKLVVNMPLNLLFSVLPRMQRQVGQIAFSQPASTLAKVSIDEAMARVLQLPAVAAKDFLITIGDRSVSGLVYRDQMVGAWQVPVADVGITLASYSGYRGEAMALGERSPLSLINPMAMARMAVGEVLTNIVAAAVTDLSDIKLSANWMAAVDYGDEDAHLYAAVEAVTKYCKDLGLAIPMGKDSLSMKSVWQEDATPRKVVSPVTLVMSGFAPLQDVRLSVLPELQPISDSSLFLIDLGLGRNRMGGSALAQVFDKEGGECPDAPPAKLLEGFFVAIRHCIKEHLLLAYHDRSDGGLLISLCEMGFAARLGLEITLDALEGEPLSLLFNEELGAVIQVKNSHIKKLRYHFQQAGLGENLYLLGHLSDDRAININYQGKRLYSAPLLELLKQWSNTSYRMQTLRDNPECAREGYQALESLTLGKLFVSGATPGIERPLIVGQATPKVAVLREQGVNGHREMAAAFARAGFICVDVHMSDLLAGQQTLADFHGLALPGGFSYGDVLGAGNGWAYSILHNDRLRNMFTDFFARQDTFTLGLCNGCQLLVAIKELLNGAEQWPTISGNLSHQFEARLVMSEILPSPSIFLRDMSGWRLPVVVAHAQGRVDLPPADAEQLIAEGLCCVRFIDGLGQPTELYPANPNGSTAGITGLTTRDGRVTAMMPHPERLFRTAQYSWLPPEWEKHENGPWLQMFYNARKYLDQT